MVSTAGVGLIRRFSPRDEGYPGQLRDLPTPPDPVFAIGSLDALLAPCIAVVGTRNPSSYGVRIGRRICDHLARAGACLVSGMARGIDAIAHQSALAVGAPTVAVLGTGVDVPYPAAHRHLHRQICEQGLVISEFDPGARAGKGSFPRRNRIIAALAPVTLVVEAGRRSGALNTAGHALDLGRVVAAVPGPIDSPESEGANTLIRDGAIPVTSIGDVLMLAGLSAPPRTRDPILTPAEEAVWSALGRGAHTSDSISSVSGLPANECLAALTSLELQGLVECHLTGEIARR